MREDHNKIGAVSNDKNLAEYIESQKIKDEIQDKLNEFFLQKVAKFKKEGSRNDEFIVTDEEQEKLIQDLNKLNEEKELEQLKQLSEKKLKSQVRSRIQ